MKRINNRGFIATSILYGVVALLVLTFSLILGNYLAIRRSNSLTGDNIKDEIYNMSQVWNFSYLPESQEFTTPASGNYKIEAWGASGGDIDTFTGGRGAYTSGTIKLTKDDILYIYVGGAGTHSSVGGYNGGSSLIPGQEAYGSSGGGASDIRLVNGLWNNFDSLKSRIMVAAGGGGANNRNRGDLGARYGAGNGGSGGTLTGVNGESVNYQATPTISSYNNHSLGTGGGQTYGGSTNTYNTAGNLLSTTVNGSFGGMIASLNQSGSGSGYYSGGNTGHGGAGGGSSFISGYSGCNAINASSTSTNIIHTNQSNHYSGKVFTNMVMKSGLEEIPSFATGANTIGNTGNGFVRITYLGK